MKYGFDTDQLRRWVIWFALPMIIGALVAAVMQHPTILVRPLSLLFAIEFTKLTFVLAAIHNAKQSLDDLYGVPVSVSAHRPPCVSCMPHLACLLQHGRGATVMPTSWDCDTPAACYIRA